MDVGILESDHLLDVLSAPQLYSFDVWVEEINLVKNNKEKETKVQQPNAISNTNNTSAESSNTDPGFSLEPPKTGVGYEDYLLPNGLKPFRVRFDLFGIRIVTITQIDYEKLLKYGLKNDTSQSISLDSKTSLPKDTSNRKFMKSGGIKKQDAALKNYYRGQVTKEPTLRKSAMTDSRRGSYTEYMFNLDEVISLIDETAFFPQNEAIMRKGASATFAMAPMKLMQSIQSGEMTITIDRYGGRQTDEGDPEGEGKVTIPKDWIETVLRVANEPKLAPTVLEIGDNITIMDNTGTEVGSMEYILSLTCHAGCVVSTAMPSELGLCVSLAESTNPSSVCHTPILNKNIIYESMMRKSMNQDYEILFKPSSTKSTRPTKY